MPPPAVQYALTIQCTYVHMHLCTYAVQYAAQCSAAQLEPNSIPGGHSGERIGGSKPARWHWSSTSRHSTATST